MCMRNGASTGSLCVPSFIAYIVGTYITLLVLLFPNIRAYYFYATGAGPSFTMGSDGLCYNLGIISVFPSR